MFLQVMEGEVRDADRLQQQMDRWLRDLMPGASGYLGSTGGVTDAGDCIMIATTATDPSRGRGGPTPRPASTARCGSTSRPT
jgi:hypothetical protein